MRISVALKINLEKVLLEDHVILYIMYIIRYIIKPVGKQMLIDLDR